MRWHVVSWLIEYVLGARESSCCCSVHCRQTSLALQKKKAGPVDGYRLVMKALVTYQVHFSPLHQSFASAIVSCPLASNISLLQMLNKQSCCSFVLLCATQGLTFIGCREQALLSYNL